MRSGLRHLAALCALLAFSLFWVEGVWASMCPPEMEMDAPAVGADVAADTTLCPAGMEMPAGDSEENRSNGPHCPLTAAGASCAGGLPLPAESAAALILSPSGPPLAGSPDHAKDLLLAVALFHPPRA